MAYNIGDRIRLRVEFRDIAGALTDPTDVTFTVQAPSLTQTVATLSSGAAKRESLGVFYYDFLVAEALVHSWRAAATGALEAVEEGSFYVEPPRLA